MIKALCLHLVDRLGLVVAAAGGTLFAGYFPDDAPDSASAVCERGLDPVDPYVGNHEKSVQVLTRGLDYHEARARAVTIHATLSAMVNVQLTGWFVYTVTGSAPSYLGPDKRGRHTFTTNVLVRAKEA